MEASSRIRLHPSSSYSLPDRDRILAMKLSRRTVDTLTLPTGKQEAIYFDEDLPGFGLRLQGNSRRFIVQYKIGAKHRRMTLGSTAAVTLDAARKSAGDILAAVRLGHDPAGDKAEARLRAVDVCGAAMRRYLIQQKAKLRPSSYKIWEYALLYRWKCFHETALAKVDKRAIAQCLGEIAGSRGPTAADTCRKVLSSFFAWAIGEGLVDTNPVVGTTRRGAKDRDRVLSEVELTEIWRALPDSVYGTTIKLLMLTGQRREEIGGLRWSEIDLTGKFIKLPAERVKNGAAHDVPLSAQAMELLQAQPRRFGLQDFVLSKIGRIGYSEPKQDLDARINAARAARGLAPIAPWVHHDLRRSVATHMAEKLDIDPHIVEAVLNHVGGHKRGVAGVYNRAVYERRKREALERWGAHVEALVSGPAPRAAPSLLQATTVPR
jgi:integrase